MITIEVTSTDDLSGHFDMATLRGFTHLSYVHLRSSVLCQPAQLLGMLSNVGAGIKVLVSIEEPK